MSIFEIGAFLIGLSAAFGYLNYRYLRLPHTIGLVVIALAASLVIILIEVLSPASPVMEIVTGLLAQIDFHEAVMHGMLSFLLFAGALHVDFTAFKSRARAIALMATLGILISTFLIGWVTWFILNALGVETPFIWALVFGALISPTDPVAVLGLFKTVNVPETLEAKMAGESLFNDGVGVVVFTVVVAVAVGGNGHGGDVGALFVAELFFTEAVGGAVLGLIAGYAGYRAMHHIDEHNLEVLITLALVMVTYAAALRLHMSGPIAMVVAGQGHEACGQRDDTRLHQEILVAHRRDPEFGSVPAHRSRSPGHRQTGGSCRLSVFVSISILSRWSSFTKGAIPILTWGGLRGGIAVALALSLPPNEYKPTILTITYAVVLFSIIVQGLTIKPLVERIVSRGELREPPD